MLNLNNINNNQKLIKFHKKCEIFTDLMQNFFSLI